jgi:hypothetical protein
MDFLVSDALNKWLTSIQSDPDHKVFNYLTEEMRDFAVRKVTGA